MSAPLDAPTAPCSIADDNFAEELALSEVPQPGFRIVERVDTVNNWPNVTLHQHLVQILQIATGSDMDHAGFRSGICVGVGERRIELLCHRIDNPGAKTWLRECRICGNTDSLIANG